MARDKVLQDLRFFHPHIETIVTRVCCPTCGHIIGGRMKWEYPPLNEIPMSGDLEGQTLYVATVLAECPDCKSYFTQQEVTSYDKQAIQRYVEKASPAKTQDS